MIAIKFIPKAAVWLAVLTLSLLAASLCLAQQAVPALSGRVVDTTQTLSSADAGRLEAQLAQIEQSQGSQIVVLLVGSTNPEDITSYANRVANVWKIGRKEVGDGILIVIAKDDRKLRIEVSKALEGAIPDLAAKQIISNALAPALKQGQYAAGIEAAIVQLAQRIRAEQLPKPSSTGGLDTNKLGFEWSDFFIFLFFAVPIGGAIAKGIFGNKLGSLVTGGAVGGLAFFVTASLLIAGIACVAALLFTLLSSVGRSMTGRHGSRTRGHDSGGWSSPGWSGGSGGGFGGGFGSGGGGDFGGGGASGDF